MNTSPDVDAWFEATSHPQKDAMLKLREAILGCDARIQETVKWKTPTFLYKGNIASINPQAKQFVSLMFHQGGKIPGSFPFLEGGGETARYMRFSSAADVEAKRSDLEAVVRAWCEWKENGK